MPARKRSTCGNIEERGPNQFRVRVYAEKDPVTGNSFHLKATEQSWDDAEKKRAEFLRTVHEGKAAKTIASQ